MMNQDTGTTTVPLAVTATIASSSSAAADGPRTGSARLASSAASRFSRSTATARWCEAVGRG